MRAGPAAGVVGTTTHQEVVTTHHPHGPCYTLGFKNRPPSYGVRQTLALIPAILLTHHIALSKPSNLISELPCPHLYSREPFTHSVISNIECPPSQHCSYTVPSAGSVAANRAHYLCSTWEAETHNHTPEGKSTLQTTKQGYYSLSIGEKGVTPVK